MSHLSRKCSDFHHFQIVLLFCSVWWLKYIDLRQFGNKGCSAWEGHQPPLVIPPNTIKIFLVLTHCPILHTQILVGTTAMRKATNIFFQKIYHMYPVLCVAPCVNESICLFLYKVHIYFKKYVTKKIGCGQMVQNKKVYAWQYSTLPGKPAHVEAKKS